MRTSIFTLVITLLLILLSAINARERLLPEKK